MNFLKYTGITVIFCVCTAIGVKKSVSLKKRARELEEICFCFSELKERISSSGMEIEKILPKAFSNCGFLSFTGLSPQFFECNLTKKDKSVLEEFFSGLGCLDVKGETERITLYSDILKAEKDKALSDCDAKCKIFTVSGVCAGLTAAVLFI